MGVPFHFKINRFDINLLPISPHLFFLRTDQTIMRVIKDFKEFEELVQPVRLFDFDMDDFGIVPTFPGGCFFKNRLEELIEFCKKNPKYHVISNVDAFLRFNKPIPSSKIYMLGQGSDDPEIVFIFGDPKELYFQLKYSEFRRDKLRSKSTHIK